MPAKLTHTQEASFLLDIIKHSDLKSINWQAIADKKQIKKGAAQMRYQRLKQAIEKAEAAEAGVPINIIDGPRSDGESPHSPSIQTAPVTPKKPRANRVEKPKTPSTGRKKKNVTVDTSMISPNTSMMSASSFVSTTSMHSTPSMSPVQTPSSHVPFIKMEPREYIPAHNSMPIAAASGMMQARMTGMPF
ncbi:hypothetical protein TWF106_008231 [Orbilia oligospora]|uniref:Myb-like DNA-binding domain-containing protein n=1 Tax=Orbilia oligospora TaxID=2813651 RepID=A0A7C8PEB3_ORBOL|nr:hypothetical protein TWF788_008628 [Orbilia oligospora]KAF3216604.1 hypothetical protein TWF106_008231 [Orbilia oligospora]